MITTQDIINYSKPHGTHPTARHTRISDGRIELSIVGGAWGLYGDFVDTFEIAIFDVNTREFVTKHFFSESNDDVLAYLSKEELEEKVNFLFKDNFQVL